MVVELVRRDQAVILTHGNGPQVGHIVVRAEAARGQAYELRLTSALRSRRARLVISSQSAGRTFFALRVLTALSRRLSRASLSIVTDPSLPAP